MRMISVWLLKVVVIIGLLNTTIFACQPCTSSLNLDQSLAKAALVIAGQRLDYDADETQPQSIKVRVLSVMKGKIKEETISVRSWYQMCPYGIIVDNQTYLMILTKSSEMPGMYEPVNSGCSVRTLLVKSDAVTIDGEKMSLEELQSKYKLKKES
jgi:hypothetical protein